MYSSPATVWCFFSDSFSLLSSLYDILKKYVSDSTFKLEVKGGI